MSINVAYVFPGQGSQTIGMLASLAQKHGLIIDLFTQVSERLGYDLWHLTQTGPEERLNQTEYTQAAMLTADVAVFKLLESLGAKPAQLLAGHSLGEYAALVCANALPLVDAAYLVQQRGRIMQACVPQGVGAMAAIVGLNDAEIATICKKASEADSFVTPANFNAIGQTVIAGHTPAVLRAIELAQEMNARLATIIPVSVPCHCPLLLEAAEKFADYLAASPLTTPTTPVISNVDLSIYQNAQHIRQLLAKQLYSPVRWVETIQLMKSRGIELIIEAGPGKVLSGLNKRIDKSLQSFSVNDEESLQQALIVIQNT